MIRTWDARSIQNSRVRSKDVLVERLMFIDPEFKFENKLQIVYVSLF